MATLSVQVLVGWLTWYWEPEKCDWHHTHFSGLRARGGGEKVPKIKQLNSIGSEDQFYLLFSCCFMSAIPS